MINLGVRTAETDLTSGKVIVTGSIDANKLVDYVYRRTKSRPKLYFNMNRGSIRKNKIQMKKLRNSKKETKHQEEKKPSIR